jgi:glyoxylase-like metal-dependent hydrolase (beta-lactamase superfamily II)
MAAMDDWPTGRIERLGPLVRRVLAPNPSPFTFTGTQTYIVGRADGSSGVAVIDPGPAIAAHVDALVAALGGEPVTAIVCTHTHRDHSPASRDLQARTNAPIVGCAALSIADDGPRADDAFDPDYRPDRILGDGETLAGPGWTLEAVATPGHTSNHLCFALRGEEGPSALFSGDHVMGWSTTVVAPPDGDMAAYMTSLERLRGRDEPVFYPAHGPPIEDPQAHLDRLIAHRRGREREIAELVQQGEGRIAAMVEIIYREVDPRLHPAAARSVLAHLIEMEARGLVGRSGELWRPA